MTGSPGPQTPSSTTYVMHYEDVIFLLQTSANGYTLDIFNKTNHEVKFAQRQSLFYSISTKSVRLINGLSL